MRLSLLAVAVAGVWAAPSRAADPSPADVVRKAVEAHGGADALKKLSAAEYGVKGEMTLPGSTAEYTGTIIYQLPDKYRMSLDLKIGEANVALVQVVNGTKTKTTVGGNPQKVTADQEAEARQAAAMQEMTQLLPLLGDKYKLSAGGPAADGAAAVVASAAGLKDVTLYFDKASGRLVRTSRKALSPGGAEVVEESVLSDFRKVGGVELPAKMAVTHDGKPFMTLTADDPKFLAAPDPASFATDE